MARDRIRLGMIICPWLPIAPCKGRQSKWKAGPVINYLRYTNFLALPRLSLGHGEGRGQISSNLDQRSRPGEGGVSILSAQFEGSVRFWAEPRRHLLCFHLTSWVVRLRLRRPTELVRGGQSGLAEIVAATGFAD